MLRPHLYWILLVALFGNLVISDDVMSQERPFSQRIRVPPWPEGLQWLNCAGPITLEQLRGKFVLLDFWTYCCINCMHVLPELEKLERAYPRELVVIGVHSAKFDAERRSENIVEAIRRYGIRHPVVNDARHELWNGFGVRAWPTLILIDPEGYAVWGTSGETTFETLDALLRRALPDYRRRGLIDETPLVFGLETRQPSRTPLRYPGKILADEDSRRLFISDSGHHRIVVTDFEGNVLAMIGEGRRGRKDGDFSSCQFNDPQGLALKGDLLYVADTRNHLIRKVDLRANEVRTIAGTEVQNRQPVVTGSRAPLRQPLASPWDLLIHEDYLYIAMAGPHQIWRMRLNEQVIEPFAGNGREDIIDGPLLPRRPFELGFAAFAQPSGLATDGLWLYVADSEGSSIRAVPLRGQGGVRTVAGTAWLPMARLFTFGDVDGPPQSARFQHPLGVVFYEGQLFVADTYNNKIRVIDPATGQTKTLVGSGEKGFTDEPPTFNEPAGITAAAGRLFVADTNNHLIRVVDLATGGKVSTLVLKGLEPPSIDFAPVEEDELAGRDEILLDPVERSIKNGLLTFQLNLRLPFNYKLNPLAPLSFQISLADVGKPRGNLAIVDSHLGRTHVLKNPETQSTISIPVQGDSGEIPLKVTVTYFICQEGREGLCKVRSCQWSVPIRVVADGSHEPIVLETRP